MIDRKLKPIESKFISIYLDPKRGAGNATKTAALVWPQKYGNYKKDLKTNERARNIGRLYVKKLKINLNDAFEALGFTTLARAKKGLEFLNAKKIIYDSKNKRHKINDHYLQLKAYEILLRFCEKETLRHEIAIEEKPPMILHHKIDGLDLTGLNIDDLKAFALNFNLKPEQISSEAINVKKADETEKI